MLHPATLVTFRWGRYANYLGVILSCDMEQEVAMVRVLFGQRFWVRTPSVVLVEPQRIEDYRFITEGKACKALLFIEFILSGEGHLYYIFSRWNASEGRDKSIQERCLGGL